MRTASFLCSIFLYYLVSASPAGANELKVFVLAGQSNMEGQAEVATRDKVTGDYLNGTLGYLLTDPRTASLVAPCWDKDAQNWTVLDDVKVWYNENGKQLGTNGSQIPSLPGNATFGSLTVGFGSGGNPNLIGPEYGFGFGMHAALDKVAGEKILLVKTAWGGKTLAGDFRPPLSAAQWKQDPFCTDESKCASTGHYYQVMIDDVRKMLAPGAIATMFPELSSLTPRVAGFGWFQGWNDGCDLNATAAYEANMVNLVKDLRREWEAPGLPVVIAASGFNGFPVPSEESTRTPRSEVPWVDMQPSEKVATNCANDRGCRRIDIVLSQFAAANATRHPELGGGVTTVETRGFYRQPEYSPNKGQGYHFWHNAETYFLVGQGMAKAMLALLGR